MSVVIRIPATLRKYAANQSMVSVEADSLGAALESAFTTHNDLKRRLFSENGQLHRYINIYVNGENARRSGGLTIELAPGDEILIVPAFAGG